MDLNKFSRIRILPLALMAALAVGPVFAEKPEGAGQGKGNKHEQKEKGGGKKNEESRQVPAEVKVGGYFGEPQRIAVREYYGKQHRTGRCPPGLAKKNNGCMPPGQAKKWAVGQALPRDVVYYPIPQPVVLKLGIPPTGYKYVRVASDILMIALGTNMVVDAIQDLGRI